MAAEKAIVERGPVAMMEKAPTSVMSEIGSTRESQEVQAAVFMAKQYPRSLALVREEVLEACSYQVLAEASQYSYSKGGTEVSGPSIRMAEALKSAFGNMDSGWMEVERRNPLGNMPGESVIVAFAWDIQKNVRAKRTFTVRHWRDKKNGGGYALKDEREIYELNANQAARRVRACILELIPKYIQDEALDKCDETLKKNLGPVAKRIELMKSAFSKMGITVEMIEKRIGHKIEATTDTELLNLQKVFNSIKDGFADKTQYFDFGTVHQAPVENNVDAQEQPAATAEPQSIKKVVKNYAPQTQIEAQARKAEPAESSPSEPAKVADQGKIDRAALITSVCETGKLLGLAGDKFTARIKELTNKSPGQLTSKELEDLLVVLKTDLANMEEN